MESEPRIPRTPSATLRDLERRRLIGWRESIDAQTRRVADQAIGERLAAVLSPRPPGLLALYWPIRGEPDLSGSLDRLARAGWRFALPRVIGRGQPLDFGAWKPGQPMREVGYGLMLPEPFEGVVPDVLVIPCVGFDRRCFRLGYGAGFYDRTLGDAAFAARPVAAIGVAYDGCEVMRFEAQTHDRPLDCVLTETRLIETRRPGPAGPGPAGPGPA